MTPSVENNKEENYLKGIESTISCTITFRQYETINIWSIISCSYCKIYCYRKIFGNHGRPKCFFIFKTQNIVACKELFLMNLNQTRFYYIRNEEDIEFHVKFSRNPFYSIVDGQLVLSMLCGWARTNRQTDIVLSITFSV